MDRIIVANVNRYDHEGAFKKWGFIDWQQTSKVSYKVGDIVYVSCTAPIQKIVYKTIVEKINLTVDEIVNDYEFWTDKNEYNSSPTDYYVRLKLISKIDDDRLSISYLKAKGLILETDTFQGSRVKENNPSLFSHIESVFSEVDNQEMVELEHQTKLRDKEILYIESIEDEMDQKGLEGTDRIAITKARVNQSVFRRKLIKKYHKCCLCNVESSDLLIASHIKSWAECEPEERLLVDNGLLLCPNHDKLFDAGLISFDENGLIMISENISDNDCKAMGISMQRIIMNEKMSEFMTYHRMKHGFDI